MVIIDNNPRSGMNLKYGWPNNMSKENIEKEKAEIDEIFKKAEELLKDPEYQRKSREFIRLSSYISAEDLDRPFTI